VEPRARNSLLIGVALTLVTSACQALQGGEGLRGTAHDFTAGRAGAQESSQGLCAYCHTPQDARTTKLAWNLASSGASGTGADRHFRWDTPATSAGTRLPEISSADSRGPSARCLTCHDGSVAPGDSALPAATPAMGLPTVLAANVAPGGDLSGNHPIGVPYPLGGVPNFYNGVISGSNGGFVPSEWRPDPLAGANASIRLYRQDGAGGVSAIQRGATTVNAGIECSSCHDPHNKASVDAMFLRGKRSGHSQADGYLCEQCHSM
jgi:hypothetical protein